MSSALLSLAGWYILPNLATTYVQSFYYTLTTRAGDPKPSPGTPRFARDRKRIQILVILVYLAYTLFEAGYQLRKDGDFYSLLGVGHDVDEAGVGRRFRRLTLLHHPDKTTAALPKPQIEAHYHALTLARDTLTAPTLRYAYDRLGPVALTWSKQNLSTPRDYIWRGLTQTAGYYVMSGMVLGLLGLAGYAREGRYWRYVVLGALGVGEAWVLTRGSWPGVLTAGNRVLRSAGWGEGYVPWQVIVLARKVAVTFFIALAQLGPLLQQGGAGSLETEGEGAGRELVERLEALTRAADGEVGRLMGLELTPFAGDAGSLRGLREGVKEWLVQNTVRNDKEVGTAVARVLERRRAAGGVLQSADG